MQNCFAVVKYDFVVLNYHSVQVHAYDISQQINIEQKVSSCILAKWYYIWYQINYICKSN